jgi:hypothetical protein
MNVRDYDVPQPCPVSWETMQPLQNQAARHCPCCDAKVYDFDAMSRSEIDDLIATGDAVCARLQHHQDGTIVSRDNPIKKRLQVITSGVATVALVACGRSDPRVPADSSGLPSATVVAPSSVSEASSVSPRGTTAPSTAPVATSPLPVRPPRRLGKTHRVP